MTDDQSTLNPNKSGASNETRRLYAEQVKLLYANVPVSSITTLVNSSILTFILWKMISHTILISWLAGLFLVTFIRYLLVCKYRRASAESLKSRRWGGWLTLCIGAVGLAWGTAAIFLFSVESIAHQVFLVFVVGGMMTGAVSSYSVMPRASISFSLFISVPLIARVFAQGGDIPIAMGAMMLLFTIIIIIVSKGMHTTITRSLKLQFENSAMVTTLATEKERVEKLNEELKSEITERKRVENELRQHRDQLEVLVRKRTAAMEEEIIERKYTEGLLKQKFIELNTFINNIPDMAWLKDAESRFIAVNKAFGLTVGVNPEYLINNSCEVCFGPETAKKFRKDDLNVMQAGNQVVIEEKIADYQGNEIWLETVKSPIFNESGKVVGTVGIARDVTERRRLEEQLHQAQKMKAVGTLAGGIAHDFNNLLTGIQGYTDLIIMQLNQDDQIYSDVKEIQQNIKRATRLTRQLLLFSRRQPMEISSLNLNSTVKDMMHMLKQLIGEDISITTEIEDGLRTIKGEPGNIEQVIMNLVINARDAMPEGGKILIKTENVYIDEVYCKTYSFARPGNFACLTIKDTGMGMDKQTIEHIFEPFFSTKGMAKASGLGLSIVYGIINQHQGWINMESSPGNGAIFRIYLPASSEKPKEIKEAAVSFEKLKGRGERILLVEDEKMVREFSQRGLSGNGYQVFSAENVQKALDIFRQEDGNFDLIFSDVVLPDGKGPRLVEQLSKYKPGINVLFTSGYTDGKSDWQTIQKSGCRYLQKPYSLSELLQVVQAAIKA